MTPPERREGETPLTDAFVDVAPAVVLPTGSSPETINSVRVLMIAWAEFARSLERSLAQARAEAIEECAKVCEQTWRESPNERPEYLQNKLSHGCLACATAIRSLAQSIATGGKG